MPSGEHRALDVLAVGHAIVDILTHCDDDLLGTLGLEKGTMTLVDDTRAEEIYGTLGPAVETSGGSAANTAVGVASFGGTASFAGRVAGDQFGEVFTHDISAAGVSFTAAPATTGSTAHCLVLVTPDAQRTMATHLGVAGTLGSCDISTTLVEAAAVTYLEGYLVGTPGQAALETAADLAHRAGRQVALTLSDPSWVGLHAAAFLDLLGVVDLLFANEAEATALTGAASADEALGLLAALCPVVTITRGEQGAIVAAADQPPQAVPARVVDRVVDTTGAGDLYAAGFLFGFTRGLPLESCAELGCLAASEVIRHDGARCPDPLHGLLGPHLPLPDRNSTSSQPMTQGASA